MFARAHVFAHAHTHTCMYIHVECYLYNFVITTTVVIELLKYKIIFKGARSTMANTILAVALFNLKYKNYLMLKMICILPLNEMDNVAFVIMLYIEHVATGPVYN